MFPLIPLLLVGGYWLAYDGWQRISAFSPSSVLGGLPGGISGAAGTLVNPTLTQDQQSNEAGILNKWTHAIATSGIASRNPAAKAAYDANVRPKVAAFSANPSQASFQAAFDALVAFAKTYHVKVAGTPNATSANP